MNFETEQSMKFSNHSNEESIIFRIVLFQQARKLYEQL